MAAAAEAAAAAGSASPDTSLDRRHRWRWPRRQRRRPAAACARAGPAGGTEGRGGRGTWAEGQAPKEPSPAPHSSPPSPTTRGRGGAVVAEAANATSSLPLAPPSCFTTAFSGTTPREQPPHLCPSAPLPLPASSRAHPQVRGGGGQLRAEHLDAHAVTGRLGGHLLAKSAQVQVGLLLQGGEAGGEAVKHGVGEPAQVLSASTEASLCRTHNVQRAHPPAWAGAEGGTPSPQHNV